MPQPPINLRRYLPCTMIVDVLGTPVPNILRVDFRLTLPTFGFNLTAQALLSEEVFLEQREGRDDFLMAIGRDAITRALGAMMDRPRVPLLPAPAPSSSQEREAAFDGDLPFSPGDKEFLRAYRISPE